MTRHFCWWCGLYWVGIWDPTLTVLRLEGPRRICSKCRRKLRIGEVERRRPSMRVTFPPD